MDRKKIKLLIALRGYKIRCGETMEISEDGKNFVGVLQCALLEDSDGYNVTEKEIGSNKKYVVKLEHKQ